MTSGGFRIVSDTLVNIAILSVFLSVRLSVMFVYLYCVETRKHILKLFNSRVATQF